METLELEREILKKESERKEQETKIRKQRETGGCILPGSSSDIRFEGLEFQPVKAGQK